VNRQDARDAKKIKNQGVFPGDPGVLAVKIHRI